MSLSKFIADQVDEEVMSTTCMICQFSFPTVSHLAVIENEKEMQTLVCLECAYRVKSIVLAATTSMGDNYAFGKRQGKLRGMDPSRFDSVLRPLCRPQNFSSGPRMEANYRERLPQAFQRVQQPMNLTEKTNLLKMQQFRMIIPNLLYVIGLPKRYAQENMLTSNKFFGQYGKIERIHINSNTKDCYEQQGQCAVYIWFESEANVAIALKCLNGLKVASPSGSTYSILKCSFGTSKYCLNFLKEAECEAHSSVTATCPFLHYIERRRDKVIQDDNEFKDFISQQDQIVDRFVAAIGAKEVGSKIDFYNSAHKDAFLQQGLPSPTYILGKSIKAIEYEISRSRRVANSISRVQFLIVNGGDSELQSKSSRRKNRKKGVSLPVLRPVSVKITSYCKGGLLFSHEVEVSAIKELKSAIEALLISGGLPQEVIVWLSLLTKDGIFEKNYNELPPEQKEELHKMVASYTSKAPRKKKMSGEEEKKLEAAYKSSTPFYPFDRDIDSHQQRVVTECMDFLDIDD